MGKGLRPDSEVHKNEPILNISGLREGKQQKLHTLEEQRLPSSKVGSEEWKAQRTPNVKVGSKAWNGV